ncbi:MAG: hypothetical protein AB7E55_25730 [Pigmentiphaga sp.]
MQKIENKKYRKLAQETLSELNKIYKNKTGKTFHLKDLDGIIVFLQSHSKETEAAVRDFLKDELSIANMGISCIGLLSLSVNPNEHPDELFPRDWLTPSQVNPNLVLSHMLSHLANYGLSVQYLIEKGLDAQARTQLRLLIELSWLILSLIYKKDLWSSYVTAGEENESKFWSKNLKSYQLNKILNDLEKNAGLDEDTLIILQSTRKESYATYSNVVHHSFTSVMLGSIAFSESDENLNFGLFGEVNSASKATINQLNFVLWYFIISFFSIMEKVHGFHPKTPNKDFWLEAFSLNFCLKKIYLLTRAGEIFSPPS